MYKEEDIKKLCKAIQNNKNFQDLRIYASKFDIAVFEKYLEENDSLFLVSFSFTHLKPSDSEHIINILKKLKNVKEFCAHHNSLEAEGCIEIATYIANNLVNQIDYIDLSNNQAPAEVYTKILLEKGYKGVIK